MFRAKCRWAENGERQTNPVPFFKTWRKETITKRPLVNCLRKKSATSNEKEII